MSAPYLVEVRTGGEVKDRLRTIVRDVAEEFGVQGAVDPRPVPHITLFGPYNTNHGSEIKTALKTTLSQYDVVPYCIAGFGAFEQSNVIYANVLPSPELRSLRRDISRTLRSRAYNYQPWDTDYFHDFHITIAYKDVGDQFDAIWEYVTETYDPQFNEYATRVTSLHRREMMWEYDLPSKRELGSEEATSRRSWERTMDKLHQKQSNGDHENCSNEPGWTQRWLEYLKAKATLRW